MKKSIIPLIFIAFIAAGSVISGCGSTGEESENVNPPAKQKQQHSEETEQHAQEVHLSRQQRQSLGINVETLNSGSASSTIARPASITYDLDNIAKVGPGIGAKVVRVLKDLGDRVGPGEPLALMSSVGLGKAKAEYIRLKARLKSEQARYKRAVALRAADI